MRFFLKVGPIDFEDRDDATAYLALGDADGEVDVVFAKTDAQGLSQLLARGKAEAVCEPALASAARALGLQVAVPPQEALAFRAGFAVMTAHGTLLESDSLEVVIDLALALAAFIRTKAWAGFEQDEVLDVTVQRPARTFEGCVMGQGGEEFGLVLYHQQGSVQALREADDAQLGDEDLMRPCTSVFVEDEPAFVVEAMKAFTGLPFAPGVLMLHQGEARPLRARDVAEVVAALKAVTALSVDEPGVGRAATRKSEVIVHASRRGEVPGKTEINFAGTGRNELCPCGSGKKYKRCHLDALPPTGPGQSWHERDHRLIETLVAFTRRRFSAGAMKRMGPETFGDREPQLGLVGPLASYEWPVDGRTVVEHFLEKEAAALALADRQWLEAQRNSRLGAWEVLRVERGVGLDLVNLLTGERASVKEQRGSQTLVARDVMLARIVKVPDMSVLGGSHLSPLPPREADEVVREVRAASPAPGWATTVRLLEAWDLAVARRDVTLATPARIRNTDGHQTVLLEDEFALKRGSFPSALSRLAALEGATLTSEDSRGATLTFTKEGNAQHTNWKNTVLGSARLTKSKLVLSTNSRERGDALSQRFEDALAGLATRRGRKQHSLPEMRGGADLLLDSQSVTSPSMAEVYRSWLDTELPMLEGRTPRTAIADDAAVPSIHLMLKEMENRAARSAEPTGYDTRQFRRELGLDDVGARVPHHELDRAIGYGRRISETLLDFAGPVVDEPGQDFEAAVRFATRVWNVVVAQERGWSTAEIEKLRAELHTRAFPAKLLKTYDTLVARKHARFAGDLRMVGSWNVERSRGRVGVQMQALLSPELIAQATAAGLKP